MVSIDMVQGTDRQVASNLQHPEDAFRTKCIFTQKRKPFTHPFRQPTQQELSIWELQSTDREPVIHVFTIRSALTGEVINNSVPENPQQHVYDEVEGHQHQFGDFSPDIADQSVIQQRIHEKLQLIEMQPANAEELREMVLGNSDVFLSKDMKIEVQVDIQHNIESTGHPFKEPRTE